MPVEVVREGATDGSTRRKVTEEREDDKKSSIELSPGKLPGSFCQASDELEAERQVELCFPT